MFEQLKDKMTKVSFKTYMSLLKGVDMDAALIDPVGELKRLGYAENKCIDICKALRAVCKIAVSNELISESAVDPRILKGSYQKSIVNEVFKEVNDAVPFRKRAEINKDETESVVITELEDSCEEEGDNELIQMTRNMIQYLPDEKKTEVALWLFDKVYGKSRT